MMIKLVRSAAFAALCIVFISHSANAARCPECQLKYDLCAWNCYNNGTGWDPQCVDFLTAKEAALGATPDPADFTVASSTCEAQCYVDNLADLYQIDTYKEEYPQKLAPQCQEVWILNQAIEYNNMQNGPYPEQVPTEIPQWLSDEVARQEANPVDVTEVLRALEGCQVCNPNGVAGSDVVIPGGGGSSSPSPSVTPPAPSIAPIVPAPVPTPVIAPMPVPAPVPAPMPAPAPAPEPMLAPAPAPEMPTSSPPPAPVVVPASSAFTASSTIKGVCVVAVSAMAMLFV